MPCTRPCPRRRPCVRMRFFAAAAAKGNTPPHAPPFELSGIAATTLPAGEAAAQPQGHQTVRPGSPIAV